VHTAHCTTSMHSEVGRAEPRAAQTSSAKARRFNGALAGWSRMSGAARKWLGTLLASTTSPASQSSLAPISQSTSAWGQYDVAFRSTCVPNESGGQLTSSTDSKPDARLRALSSDSREA
jgi:hypothetical protein